MHILHLLTFEGRECTPLLIGRTTTATIAAISFLLLLLVLATRPLPIFFLAPRPLLLVMPTAPSYTIATRVATSTTLG